jgi:hypothetical protein
MSEDNDSKTGSSTYHISKLTESNYRSWAQQLEWILDERELWEIVTGEVMRPLRTPTPGTATISMSDPEFDAELTAYIKTAKKARSIIGSSVSAPVMT